MLLTRLKVPVEFLYGPIRSLSIYLDCYESLAFPQINVQKEDLQDAFSTTFQWLLGLDKTHPGSHGSPLLHWLSSDLEECNVFWLSGKAGSGKSTLMKFLHKHPASEKLLAGWKESKKISQLAVAGFYFLNVANQICRNLGKACYTRYSTIYCVHRHRSNT